MTSERARSGSVSRATSLLLAVTAALSLAAGRVARAEAPKAKAPQERAAAEGARQSEASARGPEQVRSQKLRQVSGEILKVKLVDVRGTTTRNLAVLLQTNKANQRLAVDLGPVRAFRRDEANPYSVVVDPLEDIQIEPGRSLIIEGVMERLADTQVLVAQRIRQGGQTMSIGRTAQQAQAREQRRLSLTLAPPGAACERRPPPAPPRRPPPPSP